MNLDTECYIDDYPDFDDDDNKVALPFVEENGLELNFVKGKINENISIQGL